MKISHIDDAVEMPEEIWVRDCNIVDGKLPVTLQSSSVFKDFKYIRVSSSASSAPKQSEVDLAIGRINESDCMIDYPDGWLACDIRRIIKAALECQAWKETVDHWKNNNAELFERYTKLIDENADIRAENERLRKNAPEKITIAQLIEKAAEYGWYPQPELFYAIFKDAENGLIIEGDGG